MTRIKISAQFEEAQMAVAAEMYFKDLFKTDQSIKVGPVEGDVFLPIYCNVNVQATIEPALNDFLGVTAVTVEDV